MRKKSEHDRQQSCSISSKEIDTKITKYEKKQSRLIELLKKIPKQYILKQIEGLSYNFTRLRVVVSLLEF